MAKYTSIIDKDLGLNAILKELKALDKMAVKVGVTEDAGDHDGVSVAEYAAYNEYGTSTIPSRPFIRGWLDNKSENIKTTIDKIGGKVRDGKWTAEDAIKRLGEFAQDGIKSYIRNGDFESNARSTVQRKGSSKPLIDTGTMRNSVRYEVVKG
jgi:hypothetical protein